MKIGLFGYGKMGKMVEQVALGEGYSIVEPLCADVCIDFSHGSSVLGHVQWAVQHKKPLIIGTTGWESDIPAAKSLIENSSIGALAAANFSLGVILFIQLLKKARSLFSDYEVAGVEYHHNQKKDAPSGTAQMIKETLKMNTPFASVRCGRIPGKHEVLFDSPFDSITLTHEAHNRESFARGAVKAAAWIQGKQGWYTLDEMLRTLYSAHYSI